MSVPAVSIITPIYNQARFLPDCLDSVRRQTFEAWEQIILDDGSTDHAAEVVARYRDPRIRYLRQDNLGIAGLAVTYNRALDRCRAPLVAILEGDDYWPADKLEVLVPAFARPEVVLAYGWTEVVGRPDPTFPSRIPSADFERWFPAGVLANTPVGCAAAAMCDARGLTFTYPCSVVVRRSALERIGGFQARAGLGITDHPTFLRLSLEGPFHFERRTTGYWRVHPAGTTVREMDRILAAVHREVVRFRAEHGAGVGLTGRRWRAITRSWARLWSWRSLLRGRQLLVEGHWREARRHLWRALPGGGWRARGRALAALAGSFPAEWAGRYRQTPLLRAPGGGGRRGPKGGLP